MYPNTYITVDKKQHAVLTTDSMRVTLKVTNMNSMNRNYNEKRNFIRMKVDTPADIVITNNGQKINGICRDLSGGGMQIEVPSALPVGTLTEVSISSSHGHEPMLCAQAEVTRVITDTSMDTHICLLGLQIKRILN